MKNYLFSSLIVSMLIGKLADLTSLVLTMMPSLMISSFASNCLTISE